MVGEKKTAFDWLVQNEKLLAEMGDTVWRYAEPGPREYKSAKYLADFLQNNGFRIQMDIAGLGPASFLATYGSGKPVMATYLEYDASAGASQDAVPYRKPIIPHGPGFNDAHNMLGVAAAIAFVGVKVAMEKHRLKGTLKVFGTTFEKQNLGKVWIARDGYLDDLDAVVGWHPGIGGFLNTCAWDVEGLPYVAICLEFYVESPGMGQASSGAHSALDAMVTMYNLVKQQKEYYIPPIPHSSNVMVLSGGQSMVVMPDIAQIVFCFRAPTIEYSEKAELLFRNCAQAAASAAGCSVKEHLISKLRPFKPNHTMAKLVYRNFEIVGSPQFSEEDKGFAREIQKNLGMQPMDEPFRTTLTPPWEAQPASETLLYSDDSTEFSWYAPTARLFVSFGPKPYPDFNYVQWVNGALCGKGPCHKMGAVASKVIALSVVELLTNPAELQKAKEEFAAGPKIPIRIPKGPKPPVYLKWPEWVDNKYPTEMNLETRKWHLYPR